MDNRYVYHITTRRDWHNAQSYGVYESPTYHTEGMIHCSTAEQIVPTANRHFRNETGDLLVLKIDTDRLSGKLKYEVSTNDELFPHLYGRLNLDAVTDISAIERLPTGEYDFEVH